jgi:hydrogenase maturation protease
MATVLIIGYGNRLRSDDGLGVRVAEELSHSNLAVGAEILVRHQLTPDLAECISRMDAVLFIDAARTGAPGEIHCTRVEPYHPDQLFAHQLTPETLMSLCCELYGACPQAFELSVCGECFELGDQLSAAVAEEVPHLVEFAGRFGNSLQTQT